MRQPKAAEEFYTKSILADPTYIESYLRLARFLSSERRANDAVNVIGHGIAAVPTAPSLHAMLMSLYLEFDHAHLVPKHVESLPHEVARNTEIQQFYCFALKINDRVEEADKFYQELISKHKVPASFRIMYETYIPRVSNSNAEIDNVRTSFAASVEGFIREKPRVDLKLLSYNPLFQLAFHNRDNRELVSQYCRMLRIIAPELNFTAPHCTASKPEWSNDRPLRVGFLSRNMHNHSVGHFYRNILVHLASQKDFQVTLYLPEAFIDDRLHPLSQAGVRFVNLSKNIPDAQKRVAQDQLDILVYPDIGMDATTQYMAMARLAHYQCCLNGHPDTTGIDTMDYFISSRLYEPENAQKNYTETLLQTAGIDTLFDRPVTPTRWLTREELNLPKDQKLYVCPVAIQKVHPDFDEVLVGILEKDPLGVLVLFNDFQEAAASRRLQSRILSKCPKERVIFLDWQPLDKLLSILKCADAVIVTIYFGVGVTAQYALAFGIPMASLPGSHTRSRMLHGYYTLLGVENPPTAHSLPEYVEVAVKLANDAAYKDEVSKQIFANNHRLFEDKTYEQESAQLLKDIMAQDLQKYQ
jgi:predicted O-linked N-acetylglucosamine transferase (SPINDLY family)